MYVISLYLNFFYGCLYFQTTVINAWNSTIEKVNVKVTHYSHTQIPHINDLNRAHVCIYTISVYYYHYPYCKIIIVINILNLIDAETYSLAEFHISHNQTNHRNSTNKITDIYSGLYLISLYHYLCFQTFVMIVLPIIADQVHIRLNTFSLKKTRHISSIKLNSHSHSSLYIIAIHKHFYFLSNVKYVWSKINDQVNIKLAQYPIKQIRHINNMKQILHSHSHPKQIYIILYNNSTYYFDLTNELCSITIQIASKKNKHTVLKRVANQALFSLIILHIYIGIIVSNLSKRFMYNQLRSFLILLNKIR